MEVVLHIALEVEVSQLVLLLQLEQLGKLGIGVDDTSVALVLQAVGVDVGIDLLAHLGSGHLSANGLAEETSKLVADTSGLDEARGLAVASVTALLGGSLLGNLHLARHSLLKGLEIILHSGEETNHLLELGAKLGELGGKSGRGIGGIGSSLNHRLGAGVGTGAGAGAAAASAATFFARGLVAFSATGAVAGAAVAVVVVVVLTILYTTITLIF